MGNVDPAVMSKFHAIQKQMRELEATNDAMTNYFNNVSTTLDGASGALGQAAANASKAVSGAKTSGYKGKNASSKGGSGSKGSGSKGGSSSTEKEVEDMEKLTDRYYKFEDALRNVEKLNGYFGCEFTPAFQLFSTFLTSNIYHSIYFIRTNLNPTF